MVTSFEVDIYITGKAVMPPAITNEGGFGKEFGVEL